MNFAEIKEIISEPFFVNWFLINLGFLLCGVLLGKMFFTKGKSKAAYQEALDKAKEEHAKEKQSFSNDVSSQLAELRDGILNSAQAYQKAIEVIGGHIGSTESFNNLLIEQSANQENKQAEAIVEDTVEKGTAKEYTEDTIDDNIIENIPSQEFSEENTKQANA